MNNAPGWLTSDRKPRQILIEYSRKVPQDGVVLELGSLFGATTQLLRTYLDPTCNIIVVDSWSDILKDKLKLMMNVFQRKVIQQKQKQHVLCSLLKNNHGKNCNIFC